ISTQDFAPRLPPWRSPLPNGCPRARILAGPAPLVRPGMPTVPVAHTMEPSDSPPAPPCPIPSGYSPRSNCDRHASVACLSQLLRGEYPDGIGHGGAGGESDGSIVCATGTVGIPRRTSGAGPASILARGQPLGSGERHGGSRGAKSWVLIQTQAERECEEADRTNLPERGLGRGGATMAGERGRVAVERMEQGAAGCGAAAAVAEQTGRGSRNSG